MTLRTFLSRNAPSIAITARCIIVVLAMGYAGTRWQDAIDRSDKAISVCQSHTKKNPKAFLECGSTSSQLAAEERVKRERAEGTRIARQ